MDENRIDFRHLPTDYITEMFYDLAYDVCHYTGNNTYNGGCPICHEGSSFGKKKRCWWLPDKGIIHCFNCGETWNPFNFIKAASGLSTADIAKQVQEGEYGFINLDREETVNPVPKEVLALMDTTNGTLPEDSIDLTNEAQLKFYKDNSVVHKALKYLNSRRLFTAINRPDKYYVSLRDHTHKNRLVFPFNDINGKTIFYQSRAFGANIDGFREDVRYLGKAGAEKSIFNIDKVDDSIDEVFVFEGPIDACFVKNGVATAGISKGGKDFTNLQENQISILLFNHSIVWMLDNQWVDETARLKSESLLNRGESVFMWPEELKEYKDFNELCVKNSLDEVPLSVVRKYTYQGTKGLEILNKCPINMEADPITESASIQDIVDSINF